MRRLDIMEEADRCLLCNDAPCSTACKNGDPARAIRAIRFENASAAYKWLIQATEDDLAAAERACLLHDYPIRIRELSHFLSENYNAVSGATVGVDNSNEFRSQSLKIDFCGLRCENPFFLASSAICTNYEMVAEAFKAGWAGVFYKTICLEEIKEVSPRFDVVKNSNGSFAGFRNMEQLSENPPVIDFEILSRLKREFPNKIVIASIMGSTEHQWIELAKMAEEAGVDAIELNFSCPQMRIAGMGSDVGQNLELVSIYTAIVKSAVKIPIIPKMTPNVDSMAKYALAAHFAGADAISAINTIKSVTMSYDSEVTGRRMISGYSGRAIKPIAQRFIMEIANNRICPDIHISGIGGIYTWRDALEFIQLGCRNIQICTAVMEYGYRIIDDLIDGLQNYMIKRGVSCLEELVGEELGTFIATSEVDRDSKVFPLINRELCIGCGRCYISCRDGGHQAISFDTERHPHVLGQKCVGCHLCRLVCPVGAIGISKRIPKNK